jgi:hypothetical protein
MRVTHSAIKKSGLSLVISIMSNHMTFLTVLEIWCHANKAKFTRDQEVNTNTKAAERVAVWQTCDGIPDGHSAALMDVGRRVLKGHVGVIDVPSPVVVANTEQLMKQAEELQNQEQRLKTEFPAATRAMDPEDESGSLSDGVHENGHESEESGIIVEMEECLNGRARARGDFAVKPDTLQDTFARTTVSSSAGDCASDTATVGTAKGD